MKKVIFLIGFISVVIIPSGDLLKSDVYEIQKVHNSLMEIQKKEGKLKLELIYEWSSEDEMDENKIFYEPKDIVINSKGEIYILEANWIKVFDRSGKHLRTMGGAGQGPGNLLDPHTLEVDSENNIVVYDYGNRRIQILSSKGDFLGSFPSAQHSRSPLAITQKKEILLLNRNQTSESSSLWFYLDYNGQILRERGEKKESTSTWASVNFLLTAFAYALDEKDNLYVAAEYSPLLQIYTSTGELQLESTFEVPFKVPEIESLITSRGMNPPDAVIKGMDIDSKGRFFLLALTRVKNFEERKVGLKLSAMSGDGKSRWTEKMKFDVDPSETNLYQILVFNNSGEIIASKKLNIYANNIRIHEERLFLIDTHINMMIYEYRYSIE